MSDKATLTLEIDDMRPGQARHTLLQFAGLLADTLVTEWGLRPEQVRTSVDSCDAVAVKAHPHAAGCQCGACSAEVEPTKGEGQREGRYPPDVYYGPIGDCLKCPEWKYDAYTRAYQCFHHPYCGCGKHPCVPVAAMQEARP